MASPWVQRMVREQTDTGRHARTEPDHTLLDRIRADRERQAWTPDRLTFEDELAYFRPRTADRRS